MVTRRRRYPIGIQTFSEIVSKNYVYVDKTDLVWQLADYAKYIFLSRPRRFGKSLLSSTLHAYFAGERELFEGLKIMELEEEWRKYPVLHFDLSGAKHMPAKKVEEELCRLVEAYETVYGANPSETTPGMRMAGLVTRAYEQTGEQVVVIIDEYDAPLLDVLHDEGQLHDTREVMQEFYQRLKMLEPMLKFCFITGITKFSQLSIFSTINNIMNVTMLPEFSAICGITEEELTTTLHEDIELMAQKQGLTYEQMHARLKQQYDGYHFAKQSDEVYNPYSLMNAFQSGELDYYWFGSGTPTFLIRQMQHFRTDITAMDSLEVPSSAFDRPTEAMTTALPLLYQSGYLTIQGYDKEFKAYQLGFPNREVREGFIKYLVPYYTPRNRGKSQFNIALFVREVRSGNADGFMHRLESLFANGDYQVMGDRELYFQNVMYVVFMMLGFYVEVERHTTDGRMDVLMQTKDFIYIFELKIDQSADVALRQIKERGYALPFANDPRRLFKIGVNFSTDTKRIDDWKIED